MPNEPLLLSPPAIYGDAVAGQEDVKLRNELESLIDGVNKSNFDIGDLLARVRAKGFFVGWGFNTFREYTLTLKIKDRKAEYLEKISRVMANVNIKRDVYEPLGIARLREITSLIGDNAFKTVDEVWTNPTNGEETPISEFIIGFVEKGEEIEMDDLKAHVRTLKGLVGENDLTWRNLCMTRSVAENTWDKAVELARNNIGSVGKDADGVSKDATDGACAEVLAVEYLNNPSNNVLPEMPDEEVEP